MTPISQYRASRHFNITSVVVESIVALHGFIKQRGDTLIAVVPSVEAEYGEWDELTVRVIDPNKRIMDHRVKVHVGDRCEILETHVVF